MSRRKAVRKKNKIPTTTFYTLGGGKVPRYGRQKLSGMSGEGGGGDNSGRKTKENEVSGMECSEEGT